MVVVDLKKTELRLPPLDDFDPKKWRFKFGMYDGLTCWLSFHVMSRHKVGINISPAISFVSKEYGAEFHSAYRKMVDGPTSNGKNGRFLGMNFGGPNNEMKGGRTYFLDDNYQSICRKVIDNFVSVCDSKLSKIKNLNEFYDWFIELDYSKRGMGRYVKFYLQAKLGIVPAVQDKENLNEYEKKFIEACESVLKKQ